jgi:hypothetical protein
MTAPKMGWASIARLGLVQTALGAIVVLMTSTINRVMVVELALPALIPGLLVGAHYAVQIMRPAWGYGSDIGGRRTPWIVGGMATLALGAIGAALGTALASTSKPFGIALSALSFLLVGVGVGAAGTSVLAMLATSVAPRRRGAAASAVWMMMILGFAISAPLAGHFLDPFSNERLIAVTATVSVIAFLVATLAVWGVEGAVEPTPGRAPAPRAKPGFAAALKEQWSDPAARGFTIFIFSSMFAYRAGTACRAFRRPGVRHDAGRDDKARLTAAWRHAGRNAGRCDRFFRDRRTRLWLIAPLDDRRLRGVRSVFGGNRSKRRAKSRPERVRHSRVRTWSFERRLRGSVDRLDDGSGRRRLGVARRHADGTVGRCAGNCVWIGRHRRDGARRCRPRLLGGAIYRLLDDFPGRCGVVPVCGGARIRYRAQPFVGKRRSRADAAGRDLGVT